MSIEEPMSTRSKNEAPPTTPCLPKCTPIYTALGSMVHHESGCPAMVAESRKAREGIVSEAKAHEWEHKQPGTAKLAHYTPPPRAFTRSDVLAVVMRKRTELEKVGIHSAGLLAIDHVIRVIADME